MLICLLFSFAGCSADQRSDKERNAKSNQEEDVDFMRADRSEGEAYTADTEISEVIGEPLFGDYSRLMFLLDSRYCSGDTLGTFRLTWYSNIDPEKTVEIANYMKEHAAMEETIFYDIYTEEEKQADPAKQRPKDKHYGNVHNRLWNHG